MFFYDSDVDLDKKEKGKPKNNRNMVGHGLRAAINTPIQGGAADVVMAAMIKLSQDKQLKQMGYEMQLQIHDEVVLEGPSENAEAALARVVKVMENPLDKPLTVKLEVDAKIADNWHDAK